VLPLDVDNDASVRGAVAHLLAERGRIDVLVNNAGIAPMGAIEERPLAEFRRAMEANYFGALRCIQAVLPTIRTQRQGCLVNVTSVAGQIALAASAAYTASKFALEALSEVLAQEVKAFNIRVAIVEPGVIQTPFSTKCGTYPPKRGIHTSRASRRSLRPHSSSRCPRPWWASRSGTLLSVRAGNCAIR
jgi:NAD(P)-dependent dehydrogenase (short-subunit alcohol dehydrogenase family)